MSAPVAGPRRTAPLSVALGALGAIRSAIIPAIAIVFSGIGGGERYWLAIGVGLAAAVIGTGAAWLGWRRLTYVIGATDIRVESGLFSRTARSVPYERIQDVSLEAKLLPRLFGLVAVRFETGAGGAEDLSLEYLTTAEGERLRQLVREGREGEADAAEADAASINPAARSTPEREEVLYVLTPKRLVTFGLFEFSLAVFAVLGGLLQYVDNVTDIDVWNVDLWRRWMDEQGTVIASLGPYAQAAGALAGLLGLVLVGFATGVARTMLRDWGFTLTRSARGFRRQRGLFTRTDVVMPVHRVQGLVIGTGLVRYRFGWHSISFVSLAQDTEGESHIVAPFAQMGQITDIVTAAGFHLPDEATAWQRASQRYRTDSIMLSAGALVAAAILTALLAPAGLFLIPLGLAVLSLAANLYAWEFRRFALDATQIFSTTGFLSPTSRIATRLKLHSVEITQGPIARLRGYATVHCGLAGGTFAIPGVPLAEARRMRAAVLDTITATDYAQLDQALSNDQLGFSANRLAT